MGCATRRGITCNRGTDYVKAKSIFAALFLSVLIPSIGWGQILFSDNFDGYSDSPANHGWSLGSNVSVASDGTRGRSLRINYTIESNAMYIIERALNRPEAYVKFSFKRTSHNGTGGCKFVKFFGQRIGDNYANCTFQQIYESGSMNGPMSGNGTGISGDAEQYWWYWSPTTNNGTVLKYSSAYQIPDDKWHTFQVYAKMNNDGKADGEYRIWIDGKEWYHVTGVTMRNSGNIRNFERIGFGEYGRGMTAPFQMWYDDIVISDQYIPDGPVAPGTSAPASGKPKAPSSLSIR